jgi:hypothetical protein
MPILTVEILAKSSAMSPSTIATIGNRSALAPAAARRLEEVPDLTADAGLADVGTMMTVGETAQMVTTITEMGGVADMRPGARDRETGRTLNGESTQLLLTVRDGTLKRAVKTRVATVNGMGLRG